MCIFAISRFRYYAKQELKLKYLKFIFIVFISFVILIISGVGEEGLDVFIKRFEGANKAEGGIDNVLGGRYLGAFFRAFNNLDIPMLGYGIGLGTNVGAHLMGGNMYSFGFNAEEEWSRITGECGILLGLIIISIRTFVSLDCFSQAYKRLIYRFDLLPWMLSAGMLLLVPQGQWSIPTNLGFCILSGGFTMAAIRTTKKENKNTNQMNVNYFFRNNKAGFSIGTVFKTIVNEAEKYIEISSFYLPSPSASILSILQNGIYALHKSHKGEINHITGDAHYLLYFLNSKKTIITVHDIMYYSYLSGIKKKIWKFLYIDSLKKATKIVFISEFAKQQILNHISLDESK